MTHTVLSISEVARHDVLSRIERLGFNNVILDSVKPEYARQCEKTSSQQSWYSSYGVTRDDLQILKASLPVIETIVPMRIVLKDITAGLKKADIAVMKVPRRRPSWR